VVLSPAGGCGKTRLALAVGAGVVAISGSCGCRLGSWLTPRLLHVSRSTGVLRFRLGHSGHLLLSLKHALTAMLDNCEHLIRACAAFVSQLWRMPGVGLGNSREPLRIPARPLAYLPGRGPNQQQSTRNELALSRFSCL